MESVRGMLAFPAGQRESMYHDNNQNKTGPEIAKNVILYI
jgi:hypothetical protein